MKNSNQIINWESFYKNQETFKTNKPVRFAFIEDVFNREFYEKLYQTYPKFDDSWTHYQDYSRSSRNKEFGDPAQFLEKENPALSREWNAFFKYLATDEFIKNLSEFAGIKLKKVLRAGFINSHKGDFSLPHVDGYHNPDGSINAILAVLLYFNKGWQKGDPGGTYMCTNEDESSMIFEPYNLENSLICFEQSPHSWHGSRYITKDVRRQACTLAIA
jgi:Rps23 Pro-64 3,4-dihydroxylase Tpa1-like proline 4-hydroxylase